MIMKEEEWVLLSRLAQRLRIEATMENMEEVETTIAKINSFLDHEARRGGQEMMDECTGIYEPPKMDKKRGVIYLSCPEWADCRECTTDCPFNPNACGDGWDHDWQYDEDKEEIVCKKCGQIGDEEHVEVRRSG